MPIPEEMPERDESGVALARLAACRGSPVGGERGDIAELAERALERWRPSRQLLAAPVVAIRVGDRTGRPAKGVSVRQADSLRQPELTSADGVALVELEPENGPSIAVGDGDELSIGEFDLGSTGTQRISTAKDRHVDARLVQRGSAAFPVDATRSARSRRRLRVALCGSLKRIAQVAPFFDQHECLDLRVQLRPSTISAADLDDIDVLVDLTGSRRLASMARGRAAGRSRRPTVIVSVPHHDDSLLDVLARRFVSDEAVGV